MATISLNEAAPKSDTGFHFAFGAVDFTLKGSGTHETDDPVLIAAAGEHPWLLVRVEAPPEDERSKVNENDPHQNPKVDHLSAEASPETIEKARKEAERIRREVNADVQNYSPAETEPKQLTVTTGEAVV